LPEQELPAVAMATRTAVPLECVEGPEVCTCTHPPTHTHSLSVFEFGWFWTPCSQRQWKTPSMVHFRYCVCVILEV